MSSNDPYHAAQENPESSDVRKGGPPRKAHFFKVGDCQSKPVCLVLNPKYYRDLDCLEKTLSEKISLPFGVRCITTPQGRNRVTDLKNIKDSGKYVCSSHWKRSRGIDLQKCAVAPPWRAGRPRSVKRKYMSDSVSDLLDSKRSTRASFSSDRSEESGDSVVSLNRPPKKITVVRNKDPSSRHTVLLNHRTAQTFEQVLADLSCMFKFRISKMYTPDGKKVESLSSLLKGPDRFVVGGSEPFVATPSEAWVANPRERNPFKKQSSRTFGHKLKEIRLQQGKTRGRWMVKVMTNDLPAAGTTSQVSIKVYGKKGFTDIIWLSDDIRRGCPDGRKFQAGSDDEFEISVCNIGEIYKIRMSHDNTGDFPSWFCDRVLMRDCHTDEELDFRFGRWLSENEDDGELCREMAVNRPGQELPVLYYKVTVMTGEAWNGGTEAAVYLTLYGDRGDTGVRRLIRSDHPEPFRKGQTDVFHVEAVSLGPVRRVILGHDGHGAGNGWFLVRIEVAETAYKKWVFPCNKWLDEGEMDGKIVRELKPQDEYRTDVIERENWEKEKWKFRDGNEVRLFSVSTGCPLRIKPDGTVDAKGDYNDPLATFVVIARRGNICAFRSLKYERFHLAIDNAKLLGQGRGGAYCEMRVHVLSDRSMLFESVKYPSQFLAIQTNGKPEDPRSVGQRLENTRRFYVDAKGVTRDGGVVMIGTSMIQTLVAVKNGMLSGTGKRGHLAHYRVHKVSEGGVRKFESVVLPPSRFLRMQDGKCDLLGRGDAYCEFKVHRVRNQGYMMLESMANPGTFLGMTPEGKVIPTVDTGDLNTRFYLEVIEFGVRKGAEPDPLPVVRQRQQILQQISPVPPTPDSTTSAESSFGKGDWKVWIDTEQAAQHAEVVIVVYGDGGCSGPIILGEATHRGHCGMFETGNQDQFKVNLANVGKIYKIRLELLPTSGDDLPRWKVKDVKLKDMESEETLYFTASRWLCREHEDREIMRELPAVRPDQPNEPVLPVLTYHVIVKTARDPAAGTYANVFLTVYGERGDWGRRLLLTSDNTRMFQHGEMDVFKVEAVSLGDLEKCVVGHDGEDPGEGWLCEEIVIREDVTAEHEWVFPCNRWLDSDQDDKVLERTLLVGERRPVAQVRKEKKPEKYDYVVRTERGDLEMTLGMDVYLVVYGDRGHTDLIPLRTPGPHSWDEFKVNLGRDVGKIYKVRVGHWDPAGAWYLKMLTMKDLNTGEDFTFEFNRWMWRKEDDSDTWREKPVTRPGEIPLPIMTYRVEVYTGSVESADTVAEPYLQLIGSRGDAGRRALYRSDRDTMKFGRGQRDVFHIEAVCLERVTKVVLGHNGLNAGDGWYVDKVIVREADVGKNDVYFPCSRWFDSGLEDKKIERELLPGEPPTQPRHDMTAWVTTGDKDDMATNASVYLICYGVKGHTDAMLLESEVPGKELFQRGETDEFNLNWDKDISKMYKIRVGHDGTTGATCGWFLNKIKILDNKSEEELEFDCNRWLSRDKEDCDTWREFAVKRPGEEPLPAVKYTVEVYTGTEPGADTEASAFIHLFGSRGDAGPRALVKSNNEPKFCQGQTDVFVLEAVSLDDVTKVILGHNDDREGEGWYVDKVVVTEGCDRENMDAEPRTFYFPCRRWFDVGLGDGLIKRELEAGQETLEEELEEEEEDLADRYHVWVSTADDSNVPVMAKVTLTVYGQQGKSDDIELNMENLADDSDEEDGEGEEEEGETREKEKKGRKRRKERKERKEKPKTSENDEEDMSRKERERLFYPGSNDKFDVELKDLGELYKIRIGRQEGDDWQGWHLNQVKLRDRVSQEEYVFEFDRWMSRHCDDWDIVRELPVVREGRDTLPVLEYELSVYTGGHWAADTDASVYVTLYGSHGDTGKRILYKSQNDMKFQADQVDVFQLEAVCLEKVESIIIGHDGVGHGAGWFLDRVTITQTDKGGERPGEKEVKDGSDNDEVKVTGEDTKALMFYCGRWLDDAEDDGKTERKLRCIDVIDPKDAEPVPPETVEEDEPRTQTRTPAAGCFGSYFAKLGRKKEKNIQKPEPKPEETKVPGSEKELEVKVKTSDLRGAGTHAQVYLTIFGTQSKTGRLMHGKGGQSCTEFERNQTSTHTISVGDIGDIYKIWIEHDNQNHSPSWHIDMLSIKDISTGEEVKFYADCWLAVNKGHGQPYRELPAIRRGVFAAPVLRYQVSITTGRVANSDTTANIFLILVGDLCDTIGRPLLNSTTDGPKWRKGKTDIFIIEAVNVGKFKSVILEHDGQQSETAWYVEEVVVKETSHALTQWVFPCHQWIDPKPPGYSSKEFQCAGEVIATGLERSEQSAGENHKVGDNKEKDSDRTDENDQQDEVEGKDRSGAVKDNQGGEESKDEDGDTWKVWINAGPLPPEGTVHLVVSGVKGQSNATLVLGETLCDPSDPQEQTSGENSTTTKEDQGKSRTRKSKKWKRRRNKPTSGRPGSRGIEGVKETEQDGKEREKPELDPIRELKVSVGDIGEIFKIRLCMEAESDWYLQRIKMKNERTNQEFHFHYNDWMKVDEESEQGTLELPAIRPDLPPRQERQYEVSVMTGTGPRAETDADIYCNLVGTWGDTGRRPLTKSTTCHSKFSPGQVDMFIVEALDLGNVTKVMLGHDTVGRGLGWYCNHVSVRVEGQRTLDIFPCNRWLDTGCEDRSTHRELLPATVVRLMDDDPGDQKLQTNGMWMCQVTLLEAEEADDINRDNDEETEGRNAKVNGTGEGREEEKEDGDGERGKEEEIAVKPYGEDYMKGKLTLTVTVYGDRGETGPLQLTLENVSLTPGRTSQKLIKLGDIGNIYKVRVCDGGALQRGEDPRWYVGSLVLEDVDTKEELTFDFSRSLAAEQGDVRRELPVIKPGQPVQPVIAYQVAVRTFDPQPVEDNEEGENKENAGNDQNGSPNKEEDKPDDKKEKRRKNKKRHEDRNQSPSAEKDEEGRKREVEDVPREMNAAPNQQVWLRLSGTRGSSGWYLMDVSKPRDDGPADRGRGSGADEDKDKDKDKEKASVQDHEDRGREKAKRNKVRGRKDKSKDSKNKRDESKESKDEAKKGRKGKDRKKEKTTEGVEPETTEEGKTQEDDIKGCKTNEPKEEQLSTVLAVDLGTVTKVTLVVASGQQVAVGDVVVSAGQFSATTQVFPCHRVVRGRDAGDATQTLPGVAGDGPPPPTEPPGGEVVELTESTMGDELSPAALPLELTPQLAKSDGRWVVRVVPRTGTGTEGEATPPEAVVVVCGRLAESGHLSLKQDAPEVDDDGKDTFKVRVPSDIGDIFKIRLGFDDPTPGLTWPIQEIEFQDELTGDQFSCDVISAPTVDDISDGWLEIPVVWPSVPPAKVLSYELAVSTGQIENAGTEANVYVTLVGTGGTTGKRLLKKAFNHDDKFEKGQTDIFKMDAVDLRDLQKVIVGHNEEECGSGWFLEKIVVLEGDPVSDDEDDNDQDEDEEDLISQDQSVERVEEEKKARKERRKIKRKKKRKIKKKKQMRKEWKSELGDSVFETVFGRTNHREEGEEEEEDEEEEEKKEEQEASHRKFIFPCSRWLDTGQEDGRTELELFVLESVSPTLVTWTLTVTTAETPSGQEPVAPSSAQRLIVIYGEDGHSDDLPLTSEASNLFAAGTTNVFELKSTSVGAVYKVRLGYDDSTDGNHSWYLDKLNLECRETGVQYEFVDVEAGVVKDRDHDGWTEIPVHTDSANSHTQVHVYQVEVFTGDRRWAGTDANVYIRVWGHHGDTGRRKLLHSTREGSMFEVGKVDNFEIEAVDLQDLTKVTVGHDGQGCGSGWFLEKVVIGKSEHATKKYVFNCERWLDEGEDDCAIERDLELSEVIDDTKDSKDGDWKVFVTTSNHDNSDTNAAVTLTVFGENGNSGPLPLCQPDTELFRSGNTDQFKVSVSPEEVGKVTKIRLEHDNTGRASGWHVEKVTLVDLFNDVTLSFPIGRWLCDDDDDGDVVREIAARWPDQDPLPVTKYVVQTMTGASFGSGTDAHVYVTLHGAKGDSGRRHLVRNKEGGNKFERGKTDTFSLEAIDLGPLTKVTIGHDQKGCGSGWYLDKVIVKESDSAQEQFVFYSDRWLDADEGDKKTEVELYLSGDNSTGEER